MRRAGRIALKTSTAVSLLLFVATVGLWVRSYWVADYGSWWINNYGRSFIYSREGKVIFNSVAHKHSEIPVRMEVSGYEYRRLPPAGVASLESHLDLLADINTLPSTRRGGGQWGGFVYLNHVRTSEPFTSYRTVAALPFWPVAALSGVLPIMLGARWVRNSRQARRLARAGLCPACGYDLRATPERCPECGTPAT